MKTNKFNSEYIAVLKKTLRGLDGGKYLVLGSAATLSFTSKNGYTRRMNDLDLIVDSSKVGEIKKKLLQNGYIQSTFIDKRMPFYSTLNKHSGLYYLRFSKSGVNIEILSTKFTRNKEFLKFDLYPNVWVKVPQKILVNSSLGSLKFMTLNVNLLWAIKQLLNNTLGRVMFYKGEQRRRDLWELGKLVDKSEAKKFLKLCRFGYKSFSFPLPTFLI